MLFTFRRFFYCFLPSFTMWKEKHQASKCIQKNVFPGKCDLRADNE